MVSIMCASLCVHLDKLGTGKVEIYRVGCVARSGLNMSQKLCCINPESLRKSKIENKILLCGTCTKQKCALMHTLAAPSPLPLSLTRTSHNPFLSSTIPLRVFVFVPSLFSLSSLSIMSVVCSFFLPLCTLHFCVNKRLQSRTYCINETHPQWNCFTVIFMKSTHACSINICENSMRKSNCYTKESSS